MKTVKDFTAEEKLRLLCGVGSWYTEDFGGKLPRIRMSDGPVGLRTTQPNAHGGQDTIPAIAYPCVQVLANTWDNACARKAGECLAEDCIERDVDLLLAPGVNIKRSPYCGRNFEYFSEDPLLAGTLAREYIAGLQGKGIGACLKHFLANNLEYDRFHQSSEIDERTLREIYYKPFEIACEAKPVSIMCSYNRVNGVYASENKKGFRVLRDEFGFDGAIISDWDAVRDRTAAARAGLDLEMPFCQKSYEKFVADYRAGKITEEEIDQCAERMLALVNRLQDMKNKRKIAMTVEERREAGKHIAAEGAVLLKNNGVLPLKKGAKISLCGSCVRYGNRDFAAGGGSSQVNWLDPVFDLPAQLGKRTGGKVLFEAAFRFDNIDSYRQNTVAAVRNAALSDVNVVCVCTGTGVEKEGSDRATLRLPVVQERIIAETSAQNPNTVVVIFAGAPVDTSAWENRVAAILYAGFTGMGGDEVVAKLLTGELNPCGKLSETFQTENALPDFHFVSGVTRYREGLDVGYRYYSSNRLPVLYPFGFGLSYSSFEYSALQLKTKGHSLEASYEIENTSARDGKEISQIYVRPCAPFVYRPDRELKGYSKNGVAAGKKVRVTVELDVSAFAYWSTATDGMQADDGLYEIAVGASSEDLRLRAFVEIKDGKLSIADR